MSAKLSEIIKCINKYFNEKTQEDWDNSGLACGERDAVISKIIVCLDVTDEIVAKAVENKTELIISHHPMIFSPLYCITDNSYKGRLLLKAIKNGICIYCLHTPADKSLLGINFANAKKLGLKNITPASPKDDKVYMLQIISEEKDSGRIKAILNNFSCGDMLICKDINDKHMIQINTAAELIDVCIGKLKTEASNCEINICPVDNLRKDLCSFVTGEIEEMNRGDFTSLIKKTFDIKYVTAGGYEHSKIKKVAICGGSGKSFLKDVCSCGSDVYVTGDLSYHDYQYAYENKLMLIDAGHYDTEKIFMEIISNTLADEDMGFTHNDIKCVNQQNCFGKIK